MDSTRIEPPLASNLGDSARRGRICAVISVVGLLMYGWMLAAHLGTFAGGSDSSGYLNEARLLANGATHAAPRTIAQFAPSQPWWVYSPLGFKPDAGTGALVPTYPTGLPMLIAGAARVVGWQHAADVVIWLHAMMAVVLTYAAGRTFGLGAGAAFLAAAVAGTSPVFLFIAVQTMSDVAALVWATGAVIGASRSRRATRWALASGAAFAMAVLVRPTNALLLIPLSIALAGNFRTWLAFGAAGLPGALFFLGFNHAAYGSALTTGYDDVALAWQWVEPTLLHYVRWLPILFTPLVVAFGALPWLRREDGRRTLVLVTWFAAFAAFYSAYNCTHETWWYLRFLLPAAPALVIGALLVLARAARNWPARQVQLVGVAGAVAVLLWNAAWSRRLNVLHAGIEEQKYKQASAWASDHLPGGAVIAAMQQSGALYYYTNFAIIRWDMLQPSDFTRLVTATNAAKRPLYAILFPFELESLGAFKEHMRGTNWQKIGQVHELTIWHWTPAGQGGR